MYRFFVEQENIIGEEIVITGTDVNHIKNVLRIDIGEEITISAGTDKEYICSVTDMDNDKVVCCILDIVGNSAELSTQVVLFQGYPKGDKMELIIQKMVELGVTKIVPVMTKRSIVKLDDKKASKKVERFNAIALAAAKQSKRGIIPTVEPVMSYKQAIEYAKTLDMNIIPYEDAKGIEYSKEIITSIKGKKSLGIFIGPEGGFSVEEVDMAKSIDAKVITLGHRILRTETAGMAIMSIIMFQVEED